MIPDVRGFGTVYRQAGSRFYWIQYWRDGVRHRESSGQEKFREAQKVLKAKITGADDLALTARRKPGHYSCSHCGGFGSDNHTGLSPCCNAPLLAVPAPLPGSSPSGRGPTVGDLYDAMERNYQINHRKSLSDLAGGWKNHLQPALGNLPAHALDSDRIEVYVVARQKEGAANASINRELSALKRMFRLGQRAKKIKEVPWIEMLKEAAPRTGFVKDEKYAAVAAATAKISLWLRTVMEIGYNHGWRKSELLTRRVRHFDASARTLALDPGETKNDEPRIVPLMAVEFELVQQCCAGKGQDDFMFTRQANGKSARVADFRDDWYRACCNAGVGRMTCGCGSDVAPVPVEAVLRLPRAGITAAHRLLPPSPGDPACACGAGIRADNKSGLCWSCQLAARQVQAPRRWKCQSGSCGKSLLWGELRYSGLLFHDLRRTAANNLIRAGLSEKQAMDQTGHLTNDTFKRYHIVDERQRQESVAKMEKAAAERRREATQQEMFEQSTQPSALGPQPKPN
jgi:integrase